MQLRTELRRKKEKKDPEWAARRQAKTTAYHDKQKAVSVEAIAKTKKVAFDTAQVIPFEEANYEEVGVGTVTLAAKPPPPYEIRTNRSPDKFDDNGMLLPFLGNVRMPLPNNYPVFISAKTSKDKSSDLEELPKRPKNK